MKYMKRIAALLLAGCLICALSVTVYAHETPDESRVGTVTVDLIYDGKAVKGGTLTAYRVGQVQEDKGDYSFVKTAAMEALPGDYEDIGSPKLAEDVAAFVREHGVPAYKTAENAEGKALFTDMELGLYLIVQTRSSDGYEPLKPFLVSVPFNEGGHYEYDVTAEGKLQLHQLPPPSPSPTPAPAEPKLPQTGQLNWPIPVLAVLGLVLFAAGWSLRFGMKKDGYEK